MKKWNKKAMEPVTVIFIIVGLIAGLYAANEVGLFSITTPITPDNGVLSTSVNKYFYDPIVSTGTNWECTTVQNVYFRTLNSDISNLVRVDAIAFALTPGSPLISAGESSSSVGFCGTNSQLCSSLLPANGYIKVFDIPSGLTSVTRGACSGLTQNKALWVKGEDYLIAADSGTGRCAATGFRKDIPSSVSTSLSPVDPARESSVTSPVRDAGKYTCENNNVVLKYCLFNGVTTFSSEIQDTCSSSLPCEYAQRTISGVTKDVVKCGGEYKPNIKICSSDTTQLFTTNNLGNLNIVTCGVNGYHYCSNGECATCKHGTSWCEGNKVMSCSNNVISTIDTCSQEGFSCSSRGTVPDTTASCSSSIPDGNKICQGNQQLIYSLSQRKYINGTLCRTSCSAGNCDNECTSSIKCELGALYKCDLNPAGNRWIYNFGSLESSACLSGNCNADKATCAVRSGYNLGWESCGGSSGKQRQRVVEDTSGNLLTGGTVKQDIANGLCNLNCNQTSASTTQCTKLPQCIGKEEQPTCKDGVTVGICNQLGDAFSSEVSCITTNPKGFCDTTKTPDACSSPEAQCSGTFGCKDENIYACDSNGYWKTDLLSNCNLRGCSLNNANSQCNNDCGSTGKQCVGNILKSCTSVNVIDADNSQLIFNEAQNINCIVGCSNNVCIPQKNFVGKYCEGNKLMESYNDASNFAGGGKSIKLIAECTAGCQGQDGSASCVPIHSVGKYCSGTLGKSIYEAVNDNSEAYIKDGGIRIIENQQICALDCMNAVCTTNCGGSSECDATDGKVHSCNSGVQGAVTISCNNGCSEVNGEGKCNPIKTLGRYCQDSTNLWEAIADSSNLENGGVSLQKVITCNTVNSVGGCTSGPPATCKAIHTLGKFCGGNEGKVLMEAVTNNNLADGYVAINTIRNCAISCRQNLSITPTDASCATNCDGATECSNGVVKNCANGEMTTVKYSCNGGCSEVNAEGYCNPIHALGKFCGTGANSKTLFEAVTDNSATLDGNIKINKVVDCASTCVNDGINSAHCSRYREPGKYCDGSKLMIAEIDALNSQSSLSYGGIKISQVQQCPASCNEITQTSPTQAECILDCNPGSQICRSNGIWSCTSDGLFGSLIDECKDSSGVSLGCSETTNRCKDECPVKTMDMCKSGDAYRCLGVNKPYTNVSQLLLVKQQSCANGCDAGKCIEQCTGEISCYPVDGNLHSCSNGIRGEIAVSCKSGCDTTSNQCINECTQEGKSECNGANSKTCIKNTTNFNGRDYLQYIWSETLCGIEGCNLANGQCKSSGFPNSHVCIGQDLHETDSNGLTLPTVIKTCGETRNGLKSFCQSAQKLTTGIVDYNDCIVCQVQGQPICTSTQLYQCGDIYQGTPVNVQNCQVGCINENGNYYCDQLDSIVSTTQNFLLEEDLNLVGIFKRSSSGKGLSLTNIKGTLSISNAADQVVTSSSGDSGSFGINFGKASKFGLGDYQAKIEVPEYNKVIIVNVKVTNDFKIGVSGDPILVLVPGTTPSINLDIKGGTGVPDSIVGSTAPQGISSYEVRKNEALGKWQLFATGDPGIYNLNLSAVQNGVRLPGQIIAIEIRKPQLTITTGITDSIKTGKKNYDIKVTGPTSGSTTQGIAPDSITVTLNGNNIDLGSSSLGAGTYSPQFDFSQAGTYTLSVTASKAGYQDTTFSKTIQASALGTTTSPGTNVTSTGTTTTTITSGINWYYVIIIIIVIIIFLVVRKK